MANAKKYLTTPSGVAVFPRLNTPDTKFDAAGVYKTGLALDASLESTQNLVKFIQKKHEAYEAKLTEESNGRKPRMNPVPFEDEFDKDNNPTGNILFKFSSKASGVSAKTGKAWKREMKLFDASGKPTSAEIWGGSTIKVSFSIGEYKAGANCGVKCYLEAVQVLDLVSGSSGSSSEYGFSAEEGYVDDGEASSSGDFAEDDSASDNEGADF